MNVANLFRSSLTPASRDSGSATEGQAHRRVPPSQVDRCGPGRYPGSAPNERSGGRRTKLNAANPGSSPTACTGEQIQSAPLQARCEEASLSLRTDGIGYRDRLFHTSRNQAGVQGVSRDSVLGRGLARDPARRLYRLPRGLFSSRTALISAPFARPARTVIVRPNFVGSPRTSSTGLTEARPHSSDR
jgi:hypothetical protein